jgi:hypothetical protein
VEDPIDQAARGVLQLIILLQDLITFIPPIQPAFSKCFDREMKTFKFS